MTYVPEERDPDGDANVFYHLYTFELMTRGASRFFKAVLQNKRNISPQDREGPIFNKLLISLFNRVHLDRHRWWWNFPIEWWWNGSGRKATEYLCLDREWYHYWEYLGILRGE